MNNNLTFNLRRRIMFIVLVAIVLISSSIAFAFWDQTTVIFDGNEINLGEGARLEVSHTVNPTQTLVPYGSFKGENDIDEYIYSYIVTFNKEGRLNIEIDEESIIIGEGNHPFNDLIHIQIYTEEVPNHQNRVLNYMREFTDFDEDKEIFTLEVFVRVFVLGPNNPTDYLEAYQILMRSKITFDLNFNVLEIE